MSVKICVMLFKILKSVFILSYQILKYLRFIVKILWWHFLIYHFLFLYYFSFLNFIHTVFFFLLLVFSFTIHVSHSYNYVTVWPPRPRLYVHVFFFFFFFCPHLLTLGDNFYCYEQYIYCSHTMHTLFTY